MASSGDEDASHLDGDTQESGTHDQMVKKLIRLALACEYTRQPIRRADINAKALAPNTRAFKHVFNAAQEQLRAVFGMTLTELPTKEKVTISQKRKAQRATGDSQAGGSSSNAYVLTSVLPSTLRTPTILAPPKAPTTASEASYTGLYTFVIAVIYLSTAHRISDGRLETQLKRLNADNYVLGDKTDKILKRMEKEQYIVKVKESETGGEETFDWVIGPRGKVEIGEQGVAGLVRSVYGSRGVEIEELEKRLERSLGEGTFRKKIIEEDDVEEEEGSGADVQQGVQGEKTNGRRTSGRRTSGRGRRRREEEEEDEEEEEEGEEEEEEEDD